MIEVRSVSENMSQFIISLTSAFWTMYLGTEMTDEVCSIIADAPALLTCGYRSLWKFPTRFPPRRHAKNALHYGELT
jgi:hypothetical protein